MRTSVFKRARALVLAAGAVSLVLQMTSAATADDAADEPVAAEAAVLGVKDQIQYVAIPHPDDEFEAWSLIQNSPANYPVFILLTRGEATPACIPTPLFTLPWLDQPGELVPVPYPTGNKYVDPTGTGRTTCALARVNSFIQVMSRQPGLDPYLDVPAYVGAFTSGNPTSGCPVSSLNYDLYLGGLSAWAIFDLGDQDLNSCEVTWAIQSIRQVRGNVFPLKNEYGVIAASYYNASSSSCDFYTHQDHAAVVNAVRNTNQGTPGPQWVPVCSSQGYARSGSISDLIWTANLEPIVGIQQQHYGWLTPGAKQNGTSEHNSVLHKNQYFQQSF